jgi:ferritin-like metal-binding protein YciE
MDQIIAESNHTSAREQAVHKLNGEGSRLEELFHEELKDIYWAEKKMVKVLPKLRKAAGSSELCQAIDEHCDLTKKHIKRLEKVFESLGYNIKGKKCDGMAGLTKEGNHLIDETKEGTATRDVGLILAAQKMEHYEIATYGTLVQLAKILGHTEAAELLETTLEEEKATDRKLSAIAENCVNAEAGTE